MLRKMIQATLSQFASSQQRGSATVRLIKLAVVCGTALFATAGQVRAGTIINGGFETGDFSGWDTIGVTSIETSFFGTGPSGGTYQALMTTDFDSVNSVDSSALESFLGLSPGTLDSLSTPGSAVAEGSAIRQVITGVAGDTLSFDWNFLTNEFDFNSDPLLGFNDFAFWSLSNENSGLVLADLFFPTFTSSSTVFSDETGYNTTSVVLTSSGSFTLGFGVVDLDDTTFDSGLLVDNVRISNINPVPEPASLAIFGLGACVAGFGAVRRRRSEKQQAATV